MPGGGGGPNSNRPTDRRPVSASLSSSWFIKKRCSASSVPTPIAAHTNASRTIWVASNRARSDQLRGERKRRLRPASARGLEDISRAAQGVNHRLSPDVDLLAQIRHVQLNNVRPPAEVIAPHPIEDLRLAQHAFGVAHHEPQQLEFRRGQQQQRQAWICSRSL